jgi:two-component system chemotaxis sensor kinase CheA
MKSQSLRGKFMRTLLAVTGLIGVATLGIVAAISAQASSEHLRAVQLYIEQGITSKGRVLTASHARVLRGLTLDNAFHDMQRLVGRVVEEDSDLVYGLYVDAAGQTLGSSRRGVPAPAYQPPDGDAWRGFGIPESELLVKAETIKRVMRRGEDVLEVAAPVLGEGGELLGTVRYGLSTRPMREAIAQAKADARQRLLRSVLLVTTLVIFAALLGLLLSRGQAVRITRPVAELTVAAQALASGNRGVRVKIDSGDEIQLLGASFNRMVEDLDASYRQLETMNHSLEQKVEERTVEVARKNLDMRLVFDNVDQGFVTLTMDGVMALERSRVLGQWFGPCDRRMTFADYVAPMSAPFACEFAIAWEQLITDVLPLDLTIDQMPRRLVSAGRTWSFRYLPFHRGGTLEGVLLVIAEITERLAKDREEAEQAELMQAFRRLMLDRSGFTSFLREATEMVDAICAPRAGVADVQYKRTLHTLKGSSASMGFAVVAGICDAIEQRLVEEDFVSEEVIINLSARWTSILEHVVTFTGRSGQRMIEVPESEYRTAITRLSRDSGRAEALQQILTWQLEPVTKPLRRLADHAKALARRMGRAEIQVDIQANGVRIDPDVMAPLFADLVHVIRNAVDHGLEPPEEREAKMKPRQGHLTMKAELSPGTFTLEIGDDGRGIDWAGIAAQARAHGLPHATAAQLLDALCTDGVTTRREVTAISGRGVGMPALKQRIESMNGQLDVRSTLGAGTTFIMSFPWPIGALAVTAPPPAERLSSGA